MMLRVHSEYRTFKTLFLKNNVHLEAGMRKTLPNNIQEILASGDVEAVAEAVKNCEIGAYLRSEYGKPKLLHLVCSQEIVEFLVARGEDINCRNERGQTPIHCRVKERRPDLIPGLIALGGDINARDNTDQTPLFDAVEYLDAQEVEQMIQWGADPTLDAHSKIYGDYTLTKYALSWYNLFDSPRILRIFNVLRAHGAHPSGEEYKALQAMDKDRCSIISHNSEEASNPRFLEAAEALRQLCEMFGVAQQVARPAPSVGEMLKLDSSKSWKKLSNELWDLLVPLDNQAETLQGEAIRITGKVAYEVYDNGGINWDRSFGKLMDQYLRVVSSGVSLPSDSLSRAEAAVASLKTRSMNTGDVDEITTLAVEWVRLNPVLVELNLPDVGR